MGFESAGGRGGPTVPRSNETAATNLAAFRSPLCAHDKPLLSTEPPGHSGLGKTLLPTSALSCDSLAASRAIAASDSPRPAARTMGHLRATCGGVPWAADHCSIWPFLVLGDHNTGCRAGQPRYKIARTFHRSSRLAISGDIGRESGAGAVLSELNSRRNKSACIQIQRAQRPGCPPGLPQGILETNNAG